MRRIDSRRPSSRLDHRGGHAFDHVFADVAAELVPAVPAMGRRQGEVGGGAGFICAKPMRRTRQTQPASIAQKSS